MKNDKGLKKLNSMNDHFLICGWRPGFDKILDNVFISNPDISPDQVVLINEATEQIEETPNEEVETKEINEEENENVEINAEETNNDSDDNQEEIVESKVVDDSCMEEDTIKEINEIEWADENSEIDEESVEEDSENAVETPANDEVVDETSNDEIIETKSIETESQKQFDFKSEFAMLQKSFDEKLAEKDQQIKTLESKVESMTKLFAESLDTIDRMATNIKNTPVSNWLQYKRPLKKWWYFDVASIIKNL